MSRRLKRDPVRDERVLEALRLGNTREVAAAWGIDQVHTAVDSMLDQVDAVIVASSNASHHPIALSALRQRRYHHQRHPRKPSRCTHTRGAEEGGRRQDALMHAVRGTARGLRE